MLPIAQILGILSGIPWKEIIKYSPSVIAAASDLLAKNKDGAHKKSGLGVRIARLEENERAQAELVRNMAETQEFLLKTVRLLDKRFKFISCVSVLLATGLVFALVKLLVV